MGLPRFLVIADGFTLPRRSELVLELASAGVLPWVQMRDHHARSEQFEECAVRLVGEIRRVSPSTVISVNGYADLAHELNVGLHLGFRSVSPVDARTKLGPDMLIGYSAHADSHVSVIAHCDYITYSPVFPIQKSPQTPPLGLERLRHMAELSSVRVLALGAISADRVGDCIDAGAFGVAVFSGVMGSKDPVHAAQAYLDCIRNRIEADAGTHTGTGA